MFVTIIIEEEALDLRVEGEMGKVGRMVSEKGWSEKMEDRKLT